MATTLTKQVKLYLSEEGHRILKAHAAQSGLSVSQTVEDVAREVLKPELTEGVDSPEAVE